MVLEGKIKKKGTPPPKRSRWSLLKKMVSATRCDQGVVFSSKKCPPRPDTMRQPDRTPGPWVPTRFCSALMTLP